MDMADRFTKIQYSSLNSTTPATSLPESKGRNGQIKTAGLELYANDRDNLVRITPITSRGDVSPACYLEVPLDKQTLTALAEKLLRLAELAPDTAPT